LKINLSARHYKCVWHFIFEKQLKNKIKFFILIFMKARLIFHDGAWSIPKKYEQTHIKGVFQAVVKFYPDLLIGLSALDAVEAAVQINILLRIKNDLPTLARYLPVDR